MDVAKFEREGETALNKHSQMRNFSEQQQQWKWRHLN